MDNLFLLAFFAFLIVAIAGVWKTFTKAGKPGWAALIPFYNVIVMLQIAGRPLWWFLLFFVPVVNIIITLVVVIDIARNFGKGTGFGLGLFLFAPIFYPVLGFGDSEYSPSH